MEYIYIKNYGKLKEILEDPDNWEYYRPFTGGRIVSARVEKYEHPYGARIKGLPKKWWVYVHTEYVLSEEAKKPLEYDIALWKLMRTPVFRKLVEKGAVEIRPADEELVPA